MLSSKAYTKSILGAKKAEEIFASIPELYPARNSLIDWSLLDKEQKTLLAETNSACFAGLFRCLHELLKKEKEPRFLEYLPQPLRRPSLESWLQDYLISMVLSNILNSNHLGGVFDLHNPELTIRDLYIQLSVLRYIEEFPHIPYITSRILHICPETHPLFALLISSSNIISNKTPYNHSFLPYSYADMSSYIPVIRAELFHGCILVLEKGARLDTRGVWKEFLAQQQQHLGYSPSIDWNCQGFLWPRSNSKSVHPITLLHPDVSKAFNDRNLKSFEEVILDLQKALEKE